MPFCGCHNLYTVSVFENFRHQVDESRYSKESQSEFNFCFHVEVIVRLSCAWLGSQMAFLKSTRWIIYWTSFVPSFT